MNLPQAWGTGFGVRLEEYYRFVSKVPADDLFMVRHNELMLCDSYV